MGSIHPGGTGRNLLDPSLARYRKAELAQPRWQSLETPDDEFDVQKCGCNGGGPTAATDHGHTDDHEERQIPREPSRSEQSVDLGPLLLSRLPQSIRPNVEAIVHPLSQIHAGDVAASGDRLVNDGSHITGSIESMLVTIEGGDTDETVDNGKEQNGRRCNGPDRRLDVQKENTTERDAHDGGKSLDHGVIHSRFDPVDIGGMT